MSDDHTPLGDAARDPVQARALAAAGRGRA